ncbi:hypothetical protein UQW22_07765 [Isoptericola halotolerans]|uniref:hypothetical protein n=1 Tax=Isoptericola halotolerans TaxID=300560 RepID=UPI0038903E33
MQIVSEMLPEPPESQDRVFTTPSAAIVLDGASAFVPVEVSTGLYVDTLGGCLRSRLLDDPTTDLAAALGDAIEFAATELDLHPGASPSSTVAIARQYGGAVDLLVLGDTQVRTNHGVLCDDRIGKVATDERRAYQNRLRLGKGYDEEHRALLRALQKEQARYRNRRYGYWIAETEPAAAKKSVTARYNVQETPWCVIATDGAYRPLDLFAGDWHHSALTVADLGQLLEEAQNWEHSTDPRGSINPRAKRHDDKTIVLMRDLDKVHYPSPTTELPGS